MELSRHNRSRIIEILFDQDDTSEIVLVNEEGQELAFKQVYATVRDGTVYCILAPLEEISCNARDGAFLFAVSAEGAFTAVRNAWTIDRIFSGYYRMLRSEGEKHGAKRNY